MATAHEIILPSYHQRQQEVVDERSRFNVVACGRRWGKTKLITRRMCENALLGFPVAYLAPIFKYTLEVWSEVTERLGDSILRVNRGEGRIELKTGGVIDFWTLDGDDAARGRKYKEIYIDEAGLVKDLESVWFASLRPTLVDYTGSAWFVGTPKGRNFFWKAFNYGNDPEMKDWKSFRLHTITNTTIATITEEVEAARLETPDRYFRQEYEAEFIEDSGGVFRGVEEVCVLNEGQVIPQGRVYMGVDLARTLDFTVLTAIDSEGNQCYFERFNTISWERQIELIVNASEKLGTPRIWLDSTGIGDPLYEQLRKRNILIDGYKFTSTSKEQLIDNLAMLIEKKEIRLYDNPVQKAELEAYEYEMLPSGRVRMNAPTGMHDDTVLALALAAWGLRPRMSNKIRLY